MVLISRWPFSSLSQALLSWKGGNEGMPSVSGGTVWRYNWEVTGRNSLSHLPPAAFPPGTPEGPWAQALVCPKLGELYSGKQAQRELGCSRDRANWSKRFRQLEIVALGELRLKEPWETLRVWLQLGTPREDKAEPPLRQGGKSSEWINYQQI